MSNQYIIYNLRAESEGTWSRNEVTVKIVSLTRSSRCRVVKRPRDAPYIVEYNRCHPKSLEVIQIYTVDYGVWVSITASPSAGVPISTPL